MPDRRIRALREKLEALLKTTRTLEEEIAEGLKKSSRASGDANVGKSVNRRVATGPRRKTRKKVY